MSIHILDYQEIELFRSYFNIVISYCWYIFFQSLFIFICIFLVKIDELMLISTCCLLLRKRNQTGITVKVYFMTKRDTIQQYLRT